MANRVLAKFLAYSCSSFYAAAVAILLLLLYLTNKKPLSEEEEVTSVGSGSFYRTQVHLTRRHFVSFKIMVVNC